MRRCRGLYGLVMSMLVFVATFAMASDNGLRESAEEGNALDQYLLGMLYERRQDFAEAAKWYRMAAEQGLAAGQHSLGRMYADGLGVPQNDAEAVKWIRRAAVQQTSVHHVDALYDLGRMYANGRGVPEDDVQASLLYLMAAEEGHVFAQFALSDMYANGEGVPQDNVQAYAWFLVAEGQSESAFSIFPEYRAQLENDRMRLAESMSQAEVATAEGLAWCDYWNHYRPWADRHSELSRLMLGVDDGRKRTCRLVDGEWRVLPQWRSR